MASLPLELPVFCQVPKLLTVPAVPLVLWITSALPPPLVVASVNVAPDSTINDAALFRSMTSLKLLAPAVELLPRRSSVRALRVSVVPPAKVAPDCALVSDPAPLPVSVLLLEKLATPDTVNSPLPVSVPPDSEKLAIVICALAVKVPPLNNESAPWRFETVEALLTVNVPPPMLSVDPGALYRASIVEEPVLKLTLSATPIRTSAVGPGTAWVLQFAAVAQLPL